MRRNPQALSRNYGLDVVALTKFRCGPQCGSVKMVEPLQGRARAGFYGTLAWVLKSSYLVMWFPLDAICCEIFSKRQKIGPTQSWTFSLSKLCVFSLECTQSYACCGSNRKWANEMEHPCSPSETWQTSVVDFYYQTDTRIQTGRLERGLLGKRISTFSPLKRGEGDCSAIILFYSHDSRSTRKLNAPLWVKGHRKRHS